MNPKPSTVLELVNKLASQHNIVAVITKADEDRNILCSMQKRCCEIPEKILSERVIKYVSDGTFICIVAQPTTASRFKTTILFREEDV